MPKSLVHLFSSPSHGPASLPHPTVVPEGFLLLAVPAPQPSTSPICITSRQHWLERQECKQALGSTVSMHVTTSLLLLEILPQLWGLPCCSPQPIPAVWRSPLPFLGVPWLPKLEITGERARRSCGREQKGQCEPRPLSAGCAS